MMYQTKRTLVLPDNFSLSEDVDFAYLLYRGDVVAVFNAGCVTKEEIMKEVEKIKCAE